MYSFAARQDFNVLDEPFYGAFLALTGIDHPLREETLVSMETEPSRVVGHMQTQSEAAGEGHLYTKQMTHHMVDGIPMDWFPTAQHAFLIRHPARVVASYLAKREHPTLDDIGFAQQELILNKVREVGQEPVVIDSFEIRQDPEKALRHACARLDLPWDPSMLHWSKGGNSADGVWAAHWYGAVHASTGFAGPEGPLPRLTGAARRLVDEAMPFYQRMRALV
jgi:hypothetical protein